MSLLGRIASCGGALRLLSVALGVFLIFMGLDKIEFLTDSGILLQRLEEWRGTAGPRSTSSRAASRGSIGVWAIAASGRS